MNALPQRKPKWIRTSLAVSEEFSKVSSCLERHNLHTVCVSAKCPNKWECFSKKKATFLLLGPKCTRSCSFCGVGSAAISEAADTSEPARTAAAVADLGLKEVVLTMVTRDDLPDGGSGIVCETVRLIKKLNPAIKIETLVSDFGGVERSIDDILACGIDVFSHNMETVRRLYPLIRTKADYDLSLSILKRAAGSTLPVKTGFMTGLGETPEELCGAIKDAAEAGISILTVGQYLQPSIEHCAVKRYSDENEFTLYKTVAKEFGIMHIYISPLVRSSYI